MRAGAVSARPGEPLRLPVQPVTAGVTALSVLIGLGLGIGASRGYDLVSLAMIFGPLALVFPVASYLWAVSALCAVVLSRVLVEVGAPGLVNHVHFGMALVAATRGVISRKPWTPLARQMAMAGGTLLVVAYISGMANDSGLLEPGLTWLLFMEPFLIVFGLVRDPPSPAARRRVGHLLVALLVLQLPFAIWKFLEFGISDAVRGTFLDQGAGAHVMGAMALVSATGAILTRHVRNRGWILAVGGLALLLNILADAKQAIGMYIIAIATVGIMNSPRHWPRYVLGLAATVGLVVFAANYHAPLNQFTDRRLLERGIESKFSVIPLIASQFDAPTDWLLGAGPGNTVSRVALMALPGYRSEGISAMPFELHASTITRQVWYENEIGELTGAGGSSAWSLISSWVGIWGDLGLLGLALYTLTGLAIWRAGSRLERSPANSVRITLMFTSGLGVVFSYLEEPGLMLAAAAWIGLACTGPRRREREAEAGRDARAVGA
ncbi:MAG TPA: hypothetical protein VF212_14450 [Longimicrobiales bacterium]